MKIIKINNYGCSAFRNQLFLETCVPQSVSTINKKLIFLRSSCSTVAEELSGKP